MQANKPYFILNPILPNTDFGPTISRKCQGFGSTGKMLKAIYDGDLEAVKGDSPRRYPRSIADLLLYVAPKTNHIHTVSRVFR